MKKKCSSCLLSFVSRQEERLLLPSNVTYIGALLTLSGSVHVQIRGCKLDQR